MKAKQKTSIYSQYCFSLVITNSKRLAELSKKDSLKYEEIQAQVNNLMSIYNRALSVIDTLDNDSQANLVASLIPTEMKIYYLIERMNELTDKKIA